MSIRSSALRRLMNPDTRRRIEGALTRLVADRRLFSSRTQLSEVVAVSTGLSARTVRRAFVTLDVEHLLGPTSGIPPDTPIYQVSDISDSLSDMSDISDISDNRTGPPTRSPRAPGRTNPSPSGTALPPPSPASAPAAPPAGPPPPPAPPTQSGSGAPEPGDPRIDAKVRKYRKRARRMPNAYDGYCIECDDEVPVGWGFIRLPYSPTEPTPLFCGPCWAEFDALDRLMSSIDDIPSPRGPEA